MKILLVDPPRKFWKVFPFNSPSNALASLGGYLRSQGHSISIADLYGLESPWEELENILKKEKPDIAGITCTVVAASYDTIHCAAVINHIYPDVPVIGGGFMFTAIPADFLKTGHFNYAVIGEGEITFARLAEALAGNKPVNNIEGIAYIENNKAILTPPREPIEDLNTLPMPAWDIFPMERYNIKPMGGNVSFALTNSRGCVNKCSFCSEALLWQSRYRSFSASWICDNLQLLINKYNKTIYIFGDNDFLYDRERLIEFCSEMEKRKIRAYFWIEASVKSILKNKDLLPRLRSAGGFNIQMGLETIEPKVLETYKKPQDLDAMKQAIKAVKDAGMSLTGLFIWGDWNDSLESLKQGVKFINSKCDFIAPSIINPFPGTPYGILCEQEGRIKERNLWKYNQHHVIMPTKDMSLQEAQEAYEKHAYSPPVLLNMLYQALFSPYRPARTWAWEFIKLDLLFLSPRNRKPTGESFEAFMKRKGYPIPPWTFPYPKESCLSERKEDS